MSADIPSIDSNPEVIRLGRLIATYKARLVELAKMREQVSMADVATDTVARAEAVASGGEYKAARSAASLDDEATVVRAAVERIERQMTDARSQAVLSISRECRLPERAGELRSAVAEACDALMSALHEADQFVDRLDQAGITAAGARWPGCGDDRLSSLLAAHRIDCGGLPADRLAAVERRAGRRSDPPIVLERPAPAVAKSVRRKIVDTLGEMIAG
jgi:hypothetical protein